jgi:hypothetical protein
MSTRWKAALGVVAALMVIEVGLRALDSATGGTPGGPRSSSYATGRDGAAALAELLARNGHVVRRERKLPHEIALDPQGTAFLLDPPFVARDDARALRRFVAGGGRVVASDAGAQWLRRLAPAVPGSGRGRTVRVGAGSVVVLPSAAPLWNDSLARGGNALLALRAAGPGRRAVTFFEAYHGYGRTSGLRAIPRSWIAPLALLAAAGAVLMLARVRRLGPPEAGERQLDPPRRAYVDAVAATIARTRDRSLALDRVRTEVRARIAVRAGLRRDAPEADLAAAARRLQFRDDEVGALVGRTDGATATLALGRALARLSGKGSAWRS